MLMLIYVSKSCPCAVYDKHNKEARIRKKPKIKKNSKQQTRQKKRIKSDTLYLYIYNKKGLIINDTHNVSINRTLITSHNFTYIIIEISWFVKYMYG